MRNNKLHTPVGVRDLLFAETAIKTKMIDEIRGVFRKYCFQEVESPTFEYIEVFSDEKLGSTKSEQMFKFVDRDGSTMALRSDMTPPIARIAATSFGAEELPFRFSYVGNVFRYNENYQGKLREFSQAGVELLGVNSVEADAEVLSVAVNALLAIGTTDFQITIGDVGFFKGILEETGLDEAICQKIQGCIANRDFVSVEEIVTKNEMPENVCQLFIELPKLVGTLEVLAYAKRMTKNRMAKRALSRLQDLYQILKGYHIEDYIAFDLGMVGQLNYYTGIIFRGYTYGSGFTIVDGGRYDNLLEQYGMPTPAVGFGLKLSEMVTAKRKEEYGTKSTETKTLISYTEKGRMAACHIANEYRRSGMALENSLLGSDFETNFAYARNKNMTHMLYFLDHENVKVVSLSDELGGFTVDVTIDELVLPGKEGEAE